MEKGSWGRCTVESWRWRKYAGYCVESAADDNREGAAGGSVEGVAIEEDVVNYDSDKDGKIK